MEIMRAVRIAESLVVIAVLITLAVAPAVNAAPGAPGSDVNSRLAKARQATVKYHDVTIALADGYVPGSPCIEVPGLGGMGFHYVNFGLVFDFAVDELTPEILLYAPTENGVRLVGVEYVMAASIPPWFDPVLPPPPASVLPIPTVFGQPLNGPMAPHGPGEPWHYELHVWLWQANPDGIFEDWNPNISC